MLYTQWSAGIEMVYDQIKNRLAECHLIVLFYNMLAVASWINGMLIPLKQIYFIVILRGTMNLPHTKVKTVSSVISLYFFDKMSRPSLYSNRYS